MRHGNFTSSEIYKLIPFGKREMTPEELEQHKIINPKSRAKTIESGFSQAGLTYIKQKRQERKLKRSLKTEHSAKPTNWGTFIESIAFDNEKIPLDYSLVSKKRYFHKELPWSGMPDLIIEKDSIVGDIKCPWTLESFCDMYDIMTSDSPDELLKQEKPEYYWQLVSNAILTGSDFAVLWIYVPKKSDLLDIRIKAENYDGDQNKVAFISFSSDDELPYIPEDSEYSSIKSMLFEVPELDKEFLEMRVKEAENLLNK